MRDALIKIEVTNPSDELDRAKEMTFLSFAAFGAGSTGAFWSEPGNTSPWEMHPDCDELLHIIEGAIELEILSRDDNTRVSCQVQAGSFVVVPQGCWHRQTIVEKTRQYYVTPGPTLHSQAADPRIESNGS